LEPVPAGGDREEVKEQGMSAQQQIKEAIGDLSSPSVGFGGRSRPFNLQKGSDEARLIAVEEDIQKLYAALLLAGQQIDHLASKVSGGK
jgi:glycerate kinase